MQKGSAAAPWRLSLCALVNCSPGRVSSRELGTAESEERRARVNPSCQRLMGPRARTPADIACRSSGRGARGDQPLAWGGPEGRDERWPLAGCGRPKAPQAAERVGRGGRGPLCAPDTRWDAKRDVRAGQMAGFPRTCCCCCCCCIGYKIFWREEKMLKTKQKFSL